MQFAKYQGLGNDFIVVEGVQMTPSFSKSLCDRRFGVGADGVLCLESSVQADFKMKVYNSDGSIAEMCGNGLRCLVRHIARTKKVAQKLLIETDAGSLETEVVGDLIRVNLGSIEDLGDATVKVEDRSFSGRCLSTGNPHFVIYGQFSASDINDFGPKLEWHPRFPRGANVSFATAVDQTHVDLTVWERGCGLTLACGTGACATVTAGWLGGYLSQAEPIKVKLPGGQLTISGSLDAVIMEGPAHHVFDGRWSGPKPK